MARFYLSKFFNWANDYADTKRADWERAAIYFEVVRQLENPPSADLQADLGSHALQLYQAELERRKQKKPLPDVSEEEATRMRDRALEYFEASLGQDRENPRALFNSAYILVRKAPPDYAEAVTRCRHLAAIKEWTPDDRKFFCVWGPFNAACYLVLNPNHTDADMEAALEELKKSRAAIERNEFEEWVRKVNDDENLEPLRQRYRSEILQLQTPPP